MGILTINRILRRRRVVPVLTIAFSWACCAMCLVACIDVPKPPPVIEWDTADIMPQLDGVIPSKYKIFQMQGSWYWYANPNSQIDNIRAIIDTDSDTEAYYWFSESDTDREVARHDNELIAERICISGKLGNIDTYDDLPEPYVGIGFDLCTTKSEEDPPQFPHTLGTCPFMENGLLKSFLGISFRVEFIGDFPKSTRLIVQFKERGLNLDDKQPYCYIKDETKRDEGPGHVECDITDTDVGEVSCMHQGGCTVQAWHNKTSQENRTPDSPLGERNLWALQGIHFQVESDEYGVNEAFEFCLSDIKALHMGATEWDSEWNDQLGHPPNMEQDEKDEPEIDTPKCLNEIAPEIEETDPNQIWIAGKSPSVADSELQEDYPGGVPFWIMKEEVSAAQFYACRKANICGALRNWDSCTVYRYSLNQKADEDDDMDWAARSANCVNWQDARNFCRWIGGKLPTKAQWEYAAKAGYKSNHTYPWGEKVPDCDHAHFYDYRGPGCGNNGIPVAGCTIPDGNSESGMCDMIGNLWEWVEDESPQSYADKYNWPVADYRYIKGGGFNTIFNTKDTGKIINSLSIEYSTSVEHRVEPHSPNRLGFRCIIEDEENLCLKK